MGKPLIRRWLTRSAKVFRETLHATTISRWSWYPVDLPEFLQPRATSSANREPRIAYYIWHFPVLSQTFVRREIETLKTHGISIEVFAEEAEDVELLGKRDLDLIPSTRYVLPLDEEKLARYKREFQRERPILYRHVYLYIMSRRYGLSKLLGRDRALFEQAVYLAGLFRDAGITRVHSPWGDRAGFAAMLAAKLLEVPFSLQVRAHDLHDPNYHQALREMLSAADFVITNTVYNRPFIASLMKRRRIPIHTIYNGIDLSEFNPLERSHNLPRPARLLCVARLIEQKGLTYLLDACAILRDRGVLFTCEIIGGAEEPLYSDYWNRVQQKHRDLRLGDVVTFTGAKPFAEVLAAYRSADVFVLPCVIADDGRRDVTPNAIIEAMAMKVPVISTPVAGVSEIIEDGVSGSLVPAADASAVADQVERLINDKALAESIGNNARLRIESRFDAEKNVARRIELLTSSTRENPSHTGKAERVAWQES
jgi:glycosyltransferase involved in cell wall biosynthesis